MLLLIIAILLAIIVFGLGSLSTVIIIRKLGRKAQKSTAVNELFYKLTRYKATIYTVSLEQPKELKAVVYGEANNYADLLDVLKRQMKFPASTAKEAAQHAMKEASGEPLQEKIRVALQYLGTDRSATTPD